MITPRILGKRPSFLILAMLTFAGLALAGFALQLQPIDITSQVDGFHAQAAFPEAHYLESAVAYESFGRPDFAEEILAQGVDVHPTSIALVNALGIRLIKSEKFGVAERRLRRAYLDGLESKTSGTLENNLAWSMLHSSIESQERLEFAGNIAKVAHLKEPLSCEIIHTNIVTQYALWRTNQADPTFSPNRAKLLRANQAKQALQKVLTSYRNDARCYERDRTWEVATENLSVVFIRKELSDTRVMTQKLQIAKAHIRDNFNGAHYAVSTSGMPTPSLRKRFEETLRATTSAWWDYENKPRDPFERVPSNIHYNP